MKNSPRIIRSCGFAIAFLLTLGTACRDQALPTAPIPLTPTGPRFIENSSGFYLGSDGYYWWDGQPPPGDLAPPHITDAVATGTAPRPGTSGWVKGVMTTNGDQAKIDLNYSVDSSGIPYISHSTAGTGWEWGGGPLFGERHDWNEEFTHSLNINRDCNFSLEVGGNAYARWALPFGIPLSFIKFLVDVFTGVTTSWSEVSADMHADTDPGISCDADLGHSQCDNPNTPEIEYCPLEGDPANPPYPGSRHASATDTRGDVGGYSSPGGYVGTQEYCTNWIDWWCSFDGGQTWQYDYRECTHWEVE
jgi:hypothetical protein